MNKRPMKSSRHPDRLIWLSLLAVMAIALIASQAQANLHAEARIDVHASP